MRSTERAALLAAAGALAGAPLLGALLLTGLYQYGLTLLPERPRLDAPRGTRAVSPHRPMVLARWPPPPG